MSCKTLSAEQICYEVFTENTPALATKSGPLPEVATHDACDRLLTDGFDPIQEQNYDSWHRKENWGRDIQSQGGNGVRLRDAPGNQICGAHCCIGAAVEVRFGLAAKFRIKGLARVAFSRFAQA